MFSLSNLSLYYTQKNIRKSNSNYHRVYQGDQIFTDNPPKRTYTKNNENKITFKIKTGYFLEI